MRFRTGLCGIAFWICALSPLSAQAQETPAVVVKDEARTCSSDLSARFVEELGLRIYAEIIIDPVDDGEAHWTLMMNRVDENICEVRLESGDKVSSFELAEDAEPLEVVAIATRLAWIIDGMPEFAVRSEPETLEEPIGLTLPIGVDRAERSQDAVMLEELEELEEPEEFEEPEELEELVPEQQVRRAPQFSFDAVGGAMWMPAIGANLMMVRARAGWKPFRRVKFQVAGRLPLGSAALTVSGVDITYQAWSLDLMSFYTREAGERWTFNAGGGARRTIFSVTSEDQSQQDQSQQDQSQQDQSQQNQSQEERVPDGIETPAGAVRRDVTSAADSQIQNALSPWSVLGSASVSYSLTRLFAVGLETTAAMSLTERTIREDGEVIADLGRLELDIVLGLEVRF